jgi:hypothetical protein
MADLRLAVVGRVPSLRAIGYSVTADYTTASSGPYTAGPSFSSLQKVITAAAPEIPTPSFVPIDQFRVMIGLRFDFLNGSSNGGDNQ